MQPISVNTWGIEEIEAATEVLLSGNVTMGKNVQEYERAYASYCGSKYCLAVNSGSSANLLIVSAITIDLGVVNPCVIVPAVGWSTSYAPFQQNGWTLIFVDVNPQTLTYDLDSLHKACATYQPHAILTINLLGNSEKYDELPQNRIIIEDNCEAMGARYRGKTTGSFGLASSHSTYFSHHICTMEGGMVTTDDDVLYEKMLSIRSHGWTRHLPEKNVLNAKVDKFHFIYPGYNLRPTEIQAAIGLTQLKKLDEFIKVRRQNAATIPLPVQLESGVSSWFGFSINRKHFERVSRYFETRPVVTGNFTKQPAIKYYNHKIFGKLSGADYIHDQCFMIGNSHLPINWSVLSQDEST